MAEGSSSAGHLPMKTVRRDFLKLFVPASFCFSWSYSLVSLILIREAFIKKTIFLLTFVNKDFTLPPPNYWRKTIEVRGSGQGGDPPFIEVKNNIV